MAFDTKTPNEEFIIDRTYQFNSSSTITKYS